MSKITVSPATGTWTVRTDDGVIVESQDALSLVEGDLPFVIYFPRKDIAMALFEQSSSKTTCPHKGEASYFNYSGRSATIPDAAWTYENVINPDAKAIEGYIAFYAGKVTVEQI